MALVDAGELGRDRYRRGAELEDNQAARGSELWSFRRVDSRAATLQRDDRT